MNMEFTGLSPLDLLVCGLLAAGMAYVMYKCGRFGRKKTTRSAAKKRARRLEQWIARRQRANEVQMAERFHPNPCCRHLAGRSRLTMQEARASDSSGSKSTLLTTSSCSSRCICSSVRVHGADNGDYSNRERTAQPSTWDDDSRSVASRIYRFNDSELSELDKCTSSYADFCARLSFPSFPQARTSYAASPTTQPDPNVPSTSTANQDASSEDLPSESSPKMDSIPMKPEMKSQFQTYRENFSQHVSELLTKVEEQRQSLVSELSEVRGNLDVVRKEPAEVEQSAQQAEVYGQEEEQQQEKVDQQNEAKERQEEEVEELDEQLDQQDRHNDMMPHADVQENAQMYQEEQDEIGHEVQNQNGQLGNIADLIAKVSQMRERMRAQNEEYMELQRCMYSTSQACHQLIGRVLEVAAGNEDNELDELLDMLDDPDAVLPINPALEITVNVLRRQRH